MNDHPNEKVTRNERRWLHYWTPMRGVSVRAIAAVVIGGVSFGCILVNLYRWGTEPDNLAEWILVIWITCLPTSIILVGLSPHERSIDKLLKNIAYGFAMANFLTLVFMQL